MFEWFSANVACVHIFRFKQVSDAGVCSEIRCVPWFEWFKASTMRARVVLKQISVASLFVINYNTQCIRISALKQLKNLIGCGG